MCSANCILCKHRKEEKRPKRHKDISHNSLTLCRLFHLFQHFKHTNSKRHVYFCFLKAVPSELVCEKCQEKVLEAVGKMIHVMEEQMSPGVLSAVETGRNILNIIGAFQKVSHA